MTPSPERIAAIAHEAGFDVVGFGPADPGEDADRFARWIAAGRHGEMDYLSRNAARIRDPAALLPGARSVISLGFDYGGEAIGLPDGARIARYAGGRDYHRALGTRLRRLRRDLTGAGIPEDQLRAGVDAVPILERALAARAGIGFLAKSTGIIHPRRGPWLLLAEILTGADLPGSPPSPGSCGTCTACLEACPTDAFAGPFELDARRCLSYTTIELRGPIPRPLREPQGSWLFGCDVCIEVCPFTSRSAPRRDEPDLRPHPVVETYDLIGVLALGPDDWERDWTGTAMRRARRDGLRRNAAIVLGNLRNRDAVPALSAALGDRDPGVRASAAWALCRIGEGRDAVAAAFEHEQDPAIRADLRASLDGDLSG